MKILALWTDWGHNEFREATGQYGGLGYYRLVKPLQALAKAYPDEYQIRVIGPELKQLGKTTEEIYSRIFTEYDVLYMKHTDNPHAASAALCAAEYFGKQLVIDLDDNHWDVQPGTPSWEHYKPGEEKRYYISASISLASALTVSTDPLVTAYEKIQPNITVLPNCNDVSDWQVPITKHNDGKVRIGYAGSVTHDADFQIAAPALKQVLQKYSNAELHLLGLMTKDKFRQVKKQFRSVKGKVNLHFGTPSWKGYPELLGSMGWDIGIAPLTQTTFNECKSHIKWMEYSMVNTTTVASKVYPYFQPIQDVPTIEHGQTGLLAETTEDWIACLSELVESPAKRQELATNAYQHIQTHWQWQDHAHKWHDFFKQLSKQPCSSQTPQLAKV